jgi:hypothetical protein
MKSKSISLSWIGTAFVVSFALAAAVIVTHGTDLDSLKLGLRVTARWSFLFFWIAYTGKALTTLFGPVLAPLGRGRDFGLAYAAAMLSHVVILVWMYLITSHAPLAGNALILFVVGIIFTYLLAVLSFGRLAEALGPVGWRALRFVGLNYILFAFSVDFVPALFHPGSSHPGVLRFVSYAPFAAMCIVAPLLVIAASAHRRWEIRYSRARLGSVAD